MLLRTWRTGFDPERLPELEHFAETRSTPMFDSFSGCLGHIYAHTGDTYLAISLWIGRHAIRAAEESELYRTTVADLTATGMLRGGQAVEVFEVSALNLAWDRDPDDDVWED